MLEETFDPLPEEEREELGFTTCDKSHEKHDWMPSE
ncbi:MAG: hypothetical protein N4J56_007735 [Chroococcidiopsis sp. SAG 2025]|nr:hypothetical protein [Chroococcidiopsis sp. SAG 2025]MDV2998030.1 hypothetical protein [Chroococcidiopsis sp. SAG 2025]